MTKYRKKPVVVEAVQYIKGKEVPAVNFLGGYNNTTGNGGVLKQKLPYFNIIGTINPLQ